MLTWRVHAVKCWDESVVLETHVIALLQQTPDVGTVLSLRKQPPVKLGSQHLGVKLQYGSPQSELNQFIVSPFHLLCLPDGIRHQVDFLPRSGILDVEDGIFKVSENFVQWQGRHLGIKPLGIESVSVVNVPASLTS